MSVSREKDTIQIRMCSLEYVVCHLCFSLFVCVVAATSGRGEANWDQIIKLCDRIQQSVGPTS